MDRSKQIDNTKVVEHEVFNVLDFVANFLKSKAFGEIRIEVKTAPKTGERNYYIQAITNYKFKGGTASKSDILKTVTK